MAGLVAGVKAFGKEFDNLRQAETAGAAWQRVGKAWETEENKQFKKAGDRSALINSIRGIAAPKTQRPSLMNEEGAKKKKGASDSDASQMDNLRNSLKAAQLEATGMAAAMTALATKGLGAYEIQQQNNKALETYNSLMAGYTGKKRQEAEAIARAIAGKQRELDIMKQQETFLKTIAEGERNLNQERERANELRAALKTGGVGGYEEMLRQNSIMARRDELLANMPNATKAQQDAALDFASMEEQTRRYQEHTQQMVQQTREMYSSIGDAVKSSFDQTIEHMLNGTSSFKEIMISLIQKIAAKLIGLFMLQMATGLFSKFQGAGGWKGSLAGFAGKVFPAITGGAGGAGGGIGLPAQLPSVRGLTTGLAGRAGGGSVAAGAPYMVGETGRELFVPHTNGNIVNAPRVASGGGGGGVSVVNNITLSGEQASDPNAMMRAGKAIASMVEAKVREVLAKEGRNGGMLRGSFA
jgi:hypothetical protein